MHALDHLVLEPLGTAAEGIDEPPGPVNLGGGRAKGLIARLDLVGMDQGLSVESHLPPFPRLGGETFEIGQSVEDSVERRDPCRSPGQDYRLQRHLQRRSSGVGRQPEVGCKIVGPGDERRRLMRNVRCREDSRRRLDHREQRLPDCFPNLTNEMRRSRPRHDGDISGRPRNGVEVERMPFGTNAVDPDRDRHRPFRGHRFQGRAARCSLLLRLHGIFQVKND